MTASVVGAIAPKLEQAEIVRATRKPTESLDAYDYYLRGRASWHKGFAYDKRAIDEALLLFYRAIELDPEFAAAYGMAAWCHVLRRNYGWVHDDGQESAEARRLAEQAVRLGNEDAVALYTGGFGLTLVGGLLQTGAALIDRALVLDPNLASAWNASGWVRIYLGEAEIAIEHFARALRLNPVGPENFTSESGTAAAHFFAGRYTNALIWSEKALQTKPNYAPAMRMLAASYACVGRLTEAQQTMTRMREIDPGLCVATLGGGRRSEVLPQLRDILIACVRLDCRSDPAPAEKYSQQYSQGRPPRIGHGMAARCPAAILVPAEYYLRRYS